VSLHRNHKELADIQGNTSVVLGICLHCWSTSKPKSPSSGPMCTFPFPANRLMVVKAEADGRLLSSDQRMEDGPRVRPGMSHLPLCWHRLTMSSSLRSNSSKKIPPLSLPSAQKKKSAENVGVNRAIPGPGDEVEAEPDAGVLDSEKVTVVFLVSSTLWSRRLS